MRTFQVTLSDISSEDLVPLVKALRLVANLSLKDAKQLADFVLETKPCVVAGGLEQPIAEHISAVLSEAGATAVVQTSSLNVPMLLHPALSQRYAWSWSGAQPVKES